MSGNGGDNAHNNAFGGGGLAKEVQQEMDLVGACQAAV